MNRSGAALLVVLFIVMAATILALGFIARSDIELACGNNMSLITQADLLAESGLVHARGLILNPQDVDTETYGCWNGAAGQQLTTGNDYYDVAVTIDANDHCNYVIDCNAYRLQSGVEVGRSSLRAELRLDPCIAFRAGISSSLANCIRIDGDAYFDDGGALSNSAVVNGDIFTDGTVSGNDPCGQVSPAASANVTWPGNVFGIADLSGTYYIWLNTYTVATVNFGSYSGSWIPAGGSNPKRVFYCDHQLELINNVNIQGTLVVDSNLVITGFGNQITAEKNFPALIVNGELLIQEGGGLDIDGLAVVTQAVTVDPNAVNFSFDVDGGLFIQNGSLTAPPSGTMRIHISASPQKAALRKWPGPMIDPLDWSQASGAFFKNISKN